MRAPIKADKASRMKESYNEDPANRIDPESWRCGREVALQALTGARAGRVLSREETSSGCRRRGLARKATFWLPLSARQYKDPARSETPSTSGTSLRENREIPWTPAENGEAGRVGKSEDVIRR